MIFVLLSCLWFSDQYSLEEAEIFHPFNLTIHQLNQGELLLVGTSDGIVTVTDERFRPVRTYRKTGLGPGELHRPVFLGADGKNVYILSNGHSVLTFNHALDLLDVRRFPLEFHSRTGKHIHSGTFLVNSSKSYRHLITEISLNKGQWSINKKLYPIPPKPQITTQAQLMAWQTPQVRFAKSGYYVTQNPKLVDTFYKISFYDNEHRIQAVLARDLSDLNGQSSENIYAETFFRLGEHHLVEVVVTARKDLGFLNRFFDVFTLNGDYVRRVYPPEDQADRYTVPLAGGEGAFEINPHTLEIGSIDPFFR